MGSKAASIPKAPNLFKTGQQGVKAELQFRPQLLAAEQAARSQYDPQRVQQQMGLESQFGPAHYQQQLGALQALDPAGQQVRAQLGQQVSDDLASGYNLPDGYRTELQNTYRGAQAARGNMLGNSAAAGETGFLGKAALDLYQQHLGNAGNFLAGATPEQRLLSVQPVGADRSSQYYNPGSAGQGQQYGLSNYQNLLAQRAASGGSPSPWAGAAAGAASGALAGSVVGPWGAVIGGVAGGAAGYFSDRRTKENIVPRGTNRYAFNYKGSAKRYVGVMADEIKRIAPLAVRKATGFMSDFDVVDYEMLGIRMEAI